MNINEAKAITDEIEAKYKNDPFFYNFTHTVEMLIREKRISVEDLMISVGYGIERANNEQL